MENKRIELSRLYHAALQAYLKSESGSGMSAARELGRRAITLGLETLDLARVHEIALVSLVLPGYSSSTSDGLMGRAGVFFAEALTPIEETHRGAREANNKLNQMVGALNQRTAELATSIDALKQEIVQRKAVEESLRASELTSRDLLAKSRQMQEDLRQLSRQLLSVQEEERRKISRELHDVIGQTLTGINVRLAALKAESTAGNKELQQKIASTQRLVEISVNTVHRFARELRPAVLDDLGLIPALHSFMEEFTADTGVRTSLKAFAAIEEADGAKRTAMYRVAQEALTNVARHANATQVEVSIEDLSGNIRMEIKDNGKGFEKDGHAHAKKTARLGLLGMRERVEMVGGTFCVESTPGKFTIVRVEIPTKETGTNTGKKKRSAKQRTLKCP